jgi:cell wall-associated NlpC family hydrolase
MTPEQREAVIAEAKTWLGTPWRHMQRLKGVGVDCANLPADVYEKCGVIDHLEADYPRQWMLHRKQDRFIEWIVFAGGREITFDELLPGDLILWKFGLTYSHSGFWLGDGVILHAYIGQGVVYGDMNRDIDLKERERRYFTIGPSE